MSVQAAVASTDSIDLNQRYLTAVLAGISARLDAVVQGDTTTLLEHPLPEPPPPRTAGVRRLADTLGLSAFEESTLALCAAVELDGAIAAKCARAHGNPASTFATFGLALAMFGDAHWSALNPSSPLRRWRLIEPEAGTSLTASPLRVDEWVVHYVAGVDYLDQRLASLSDPMAEPRPMVDSHAEIAAALCRSWSQAFTNQAGPVACLTGPDAGASCDIVQHVCRALGLRLVAVKSRSLPAEREGQEGFLRLWARQSALTDAVLLIDASAQRDDPQAVSVTADIVEAAQFPAVLLSRDQWRGGTKPIVHLEVGRPTRDEQRNIWREQLSSDRDLEAVDLDAVVGHFSLDAVGIAAASTVTIERPSTADPQSALWEAARSQARPKLDELATRIECRAGWDSLILPTYQMALLHDIADHVRHREQVYDEWGFGGRSGRGLGVSALFVGQSGTGKTTAAEVLANELRLDLYRIDLSQVVNKYIGETEKNLRRLFDAAEDCGAILLFDEADALFGKRSEVRDSHDRYANIEVSYLLQRMETYRGLAILTTNLDGAIDSAFMRRLRFVVEFGFPDRDQRAEIWRRAFPIETPVGELPIDDLSGLNLTGGNIHNVALGASFLAAADASAVEIDHVKRAIRAEYAKLGRPVAGDDIRKWS